MEAVSVRECIARHENDGMMEINKRDKAQERILLMTDAALYTMDPCSMSKYKKRIPLEEISAFHMPLANASCLRIELQDDMGMLLLSIKRDEFLEEFRTQLANVRVPLRIVEEEFQTLRVMKLVLSSDENETQTSRE